MLTRADRIFLTASYLIGETSVPRAMASQTHPPFKNRVGDFLVGAFRRFYTIKVFTRFSVALIGCPLRVRVGSQGPYVLRGAIGDVKFVFFPAGQDQLLEMNAWADGNFSTIVFRPGVAGPVRSFSVSRFEGRVSRNDQLRLHIPGGSGGSVWLEHQGS